MKNIAIILTSLNSGGAERIGGLLSKKLSDCYNVYLFLLSTENVIYEYGGTIIDIGQLGPFYEYQIKFYKELYKIDIAISFLEIMNFANIRSRGREKVIISERCVQSLIRPTLVSQEVKIRRYYNFADEIISCSEGVKHDLLYNYAVNNKITTIYNFINKETILSKSCENLPEEIKEFLNGSEFFINVGRLHPQKNQKRVILQFFYFHKTNQNKKLLILGSGELEEELLLYIAELGLNDSVKIIPYTKNPFLYIAKAKALILSSHYEGLPNVILEAMILNCPIIAVDCLAGPRELLMDEMNYERSLDALEIGKRGILVCDNVTEDNGTTKYMARAMELLCSSDLLAIDFIRHGQAYMENYMNHKLAEKWIQVIEDSEIKSQANVLAGEENILHSVKYIVIYGAGLVGKNIFLTLSKQYKIDSFVVSKHQTDERNIFGVPIREISELTYNPKDTAVIIGVNDTFQDEVIFTLQKNGFMQYVFPYVEPLVYNDKISML